MSYDDGDEAENLRRDDDDWSDAASRDGAPGGLGNSSVVVQTKTVKTYPTQAQSFYAVAPCSLLGQEVEGGPGSISPGPSTFYAFNVGGSVPPSGTNVIATFIENRWVFQYD